MVEPTKQDINELTAALKTLSRALVQQSRVSAPGSSVPGGRAGRGADRDVFYHARQEWLKDIQRSSKTLSQFDRTIKRMMTADLTDDMSTLSAQLASSAASLRFLNSKVSLLANKQVTSVQQVMDMFSDNYTASGSELLRSTRAASLLTASMVKRIESLDTPAQVSALRDLYRITTDLVETSDVAKSLAQQLKMFEGDIDELRDDLTPSDFAAFNVALGEAKATIIKANDQAMELLKELERSPDITSEGRARLREIIAKEGYTLAAASKLTPEITGIEGPAAEAPLKVVQIAASVRQVLQQLGIDTPALNRAGDNAAKLIEAFDEVAISADKISAVFTKTAGAHVTALGGLTQRFKNVGQYLRDWGTSLAGSTVMMGNFRSMLHHLNQAFQDALIFNTSNVGRSFLDVQARAVMLGMSFDQAAKLMISNIQLFSILGTKETNKLLSDARKTFNSFGLTIKDGEKLIEPFVEGAIALGVNMRDTDQFNKVLNDSMGAWRRLATMTGITADEFMRLNVDLFRTEDVFKTMMGMDVERRRAYGAELEALRERLVLDGLQRDVAQQLVKMQQQQARAPLRERMRQAAFLQLAAQQAGLSPEEAAEAARIARKRAGGRTEEETAFLLRTLGRAGTGLERAAQERGPTGEIFQEAMMAGMGGLSHLMDESMKIVQAQQAGMSRTQVELRDAVKAADPSPTLAKFGEILNIVSSFMSNDLVKALTAGALALWGLAAAAKAAAFSGLGGLAGGLGGKVGKLGAFISTGLKGMGVGAGIGILGNLAGMALGAGAEPGSDRARAAGWLSSASTGAGIGATFGAFGGLPGMAIGAGLGGLAGLAYDMIKNNNAAPQPGDLMAAGAVNTAAIAAENMKGFSDTVLSVTDEVANKALAQIAQASSQTVFLLQQLLETRASSKITYTTVIPGANEYLNGNGR